MDRFCSVCLEDARFDENGICLYHGRKEVPNVKLCMICVTEQTINEFGVCQDCQDRYNVQERVKFMRETSKLEVVGKQSSGRAEVFDRAASEGVLGLVVEALKKYATENYEVWGHWALEAWEDRDWVEFVLEDPSTARDRLMEACQTAEDYSKEIPF